MTELEGTNITMGGNPQILVGMVGESRYDDLTAMVLIRLDEDEPWRAISPDLLQKWATSVLESLGHGEIIAAMDASMKERGMSNEVRFQIMSDLAETISRGPEEE